MRTLRWLAAPGAVVLGLAATACATLPTSGGVRLGTLQGSSGQAQHGVQIVPAPPGPGWGPADIVNGFLAASGNFDRHRHAVAREYLTPRFSRTWRPGWAATIIDVPRISRPQLYKQPGERPTALVGLTGQHFARLQTAGQDQAGSVVVAPRSSTYQFSLRQVTGGWRIDAIYKNRKSVNPALLLLSSTDFARDYLPRNLYFYSSRSTTDTLVPDPVYIPQTGPESEVKGLVNALIHPPASSWLWSAATTAFPRGTRLIKPPQVIGGIQAVIMLSGAALRADSAQRNRMADQLAWSLTQSPYATQYPSPIRKVVLRIGHHTPLERIAGSYQALVPRGAANPLFYQVSGVREPAVSAHAGSAAPVPLPMPAGLGEQPFTEMAVSVAQNPPTVAGCIGRSLYLIKLAASVRDAKKLSAATKPPAVRKRLPADCSSLSWDARGNLWVTANSRTQSHTLVLLANGKTSLAKASLVRVVVPWPPSTRIATQRVAPDGVRVAMIVGAGPSKRILIAAISRSAFFTYIAQTPQTLRVGSDITNPVAVTWLDPDHLLVLSRSSGRTQLFEVPLNGVESTEIPTPRGVTSVAASWPSGPQPHVVIGIAATPTSPGTIEMSMTGLQNPDWQPVAKGTTPVFPG
jgi:Lipoprotein LpqB beta-propeller domain/Sporulation and spore germination